MSYENFSAIILEHSYPLDELIQVSQFLKQQDLIVSAYHPDRDELYDPVTFLQDNALGAEYLILPDRNIVSRVARLAKDGLIDPHITTVASLMAFALYLDIQFEPSISFHELAPNKGNSAAIDELACFRAADNTSAREWLDLALGVSSGLRNVPEPKQLEAQNLAAPLNRWRRNYAILLKVAELELSKSKSRDKMMSLLDWMYKDFIVGGPAAIFAAVYFAPNSPPKKGFLKNIHSSDREKAIRGVMNAAWDVTHISDFVRRLNEKPNSSQRVLLASLDDGVRLMAKIIVDTAQGEVWQTAAVLSRWWAHRDAEEIAERLGEYIEEVRRHAENNTYRISNLDVLGAIVSGEQAVRSWKP